MVSVTYVTSGICPNRLFRGTDLEKLKHFFNVYVFRYFCELLLDNVTYAKTSGKQRKNDTLFWGEQFVFE